MSRKITTFKRREDYNQMKARGVLPSEVVVAPQSPRSTESQEAIIEKGITLLFQQLFMVSLDEVSLEDLPQAFREYASQVKALPAEDKVAVVRAIDFFVGRVRQGIEPVLLEWYRELKTK